jgi:predicted neuraminidase
MRLESEYAHRPSERFLQCHCSSIAECASGDLLVAFYAGSHEGQPDVAVVTVRKPAGATAWEPPVIVSDTPGKPEGNCTLFAHPAGRLFLFYGTHERRPREDDPSQERWMIRNQKLKVSTDDGHTWSDDIVISEHWGFLFRNKPIVLSNGDIIVGLEDALGRCSRFLISEDNGETWFYSEPVLGIPNEQPTLIQRKDGSLLALLRPREPQSIAESRRRIGRAESFDNGRTWVNVRWTDLPNHGAAFDMVKLRDGRPPYVGLAFNNSEVDRSVLTLALSEDEGETWPHMRNLENPPGSYEYPAIIQDRAGLLHVTYSVGPRTLNRDHIKHVCLSPEWIPSGA